MPRYLSDDLPAPLRASMGIWAEQIDEDFAAIDRMSAAGELWALIGFRDDLARWVRTSPCPNALAQAVEYADAKIAVTTMRPMPRDPEAEQAYAEARYMTNADAWDVQRTYAATAGERVDVV